MWLGCSSLAQCLASMHKALCSIPNISTTWCGDKHLPFQENQSYKVTLGYIVSSRPVGTTAGNYVSSK